MSPVPALVLLLLALLLAGPVPAVLARASWPLQAPRAALVLWQAVALAAVLAAFGCGLAIASRLLVPDADGRPTTGHAREIDALGVPLWSLYLVALALTLLVGARLILTLVQVAVRTRRRRAWHRNLVDLLDQVDIPTPQGRTTDLRVLQAAAPMAYCLPGLRSRVVVSDGMFTALPAEEVRAILLHERAHLRARHDLVLEAFTTVHQAFPRLVRSGSALQAVRLLIELLADDSALGQTGPTPLANALVACASVQAPAGALAAGGTGTLARVQRLTPGQPRRRGAAPLAYLAAAAILVVPTLAVAVPWLTEISRLVSR